MSRPRLTSIVDRERPMTPVEIEARERELDELTGRAGLEPTARFEAPDQPPPEASADSRYIAGTCRLCDLGRLSYVVRVRVDDSRRGPHEYRAYCLFCNRSLEPHEVEPLP
jgi:hypothetical protein